MKWFVATRYSFVLNLCENFIVEFVVTLSLVFFFLVDIGIMMKFKSLFRRQAGANSSKNVHNQLQNEARSLSVSSRAATPPTRRLEPPRPIGGSVNSLDSGAKPKSKPSNFRKGHHGNNMVEAADYEALRISLEEMARQNDLLEATIATATTASEEEILALRKQLADKDALVVKMKLELRNVKCSLNDNCLCQRIEEDEHMLYERVEAHKIAKGQTFDEKSTKENLEIEAFSSADHDDLRNIDPEDMDYVSPDLEKSVDICLTPDRRSISSQSEVSVACLQDRILQMEETHYSTNEELQATLQELADLQTQLTELQTENERLAEEKQVLLESLCQQTEKLEDSRSKADTLQDLLLNEDNVPDSCTEREQKLVDLLKSAQAERDSLLLKQEEMSSQLIELRQTNDMKEEELVILKKRVFLLESTVDKTHQERSSLDQELALAKEESSSRHIEISHLSTLLENARCKIVDLEQAHKIDNKSEIDNLISVLRSERDVLEGQVASLQEQLKRNQCENTKIREQLTQLQDDFKLTRNNAKSTVGDLSHQCEFFKQENNRLAAEIQLLEDSLNKLKMQNQNHLKDKEQLQTVLLEAQKHLGETERKLTEKEHALNEERRFHKEENADWIQFQTDLLTTVRVANDFKTEVQLELERINTENKFLKLRVNELESEVDKLKAHKTSSMTHPSSTQLLSGSTEKSVLSSVQQEMAARRQKTGVSRQDNRLSVKSIIDSIENATKQAKSSPGSRSSSTSSLNSLAGDLRPCNSPANSPSTPTSPHRLNADIDSSLIKVPLRDQQQIMNQTAGDIAKSRKITSENIISKQGHDLTTKVKEEVLNVAPKPASILPTRSLSFLGRSSENISEYKDPLSGLPMCGGSRRNSLLHWCQTRTKGYINIEITNFSSSWSDGLAFCALLHSYLPERIPYDTLTPNEKKRNFYYAFAAADSVGIQTKLNMSHMIESERPDWRKVMPYIVALYKHFESK